MRAVEGIVVHDPQLFRKPTNCSPRIPRHPVPTPERNRHPKVSFTPPPADHPRRRCIHLRQNASHRRPVRARHLQSEKTASEPARGTKFLQRPQRPPCYKVSISSVSKKIGKESLQCGKRLTHQRSALSASAPLQRSSARQSNYPTEKRYTSNAIAHPTRATKAPTDGMKGKSSPFRAASGTRSSTGLQPR